MPTYVELVFFLNESIKTTTKFYLVVSIYAKSDLESFVMNVLLVYVISVSSFSRPFFGFVQAMCATVNIRNLLPPVFYYNMGKCILNSLQPIII